MWNFQSSRLSWRRQARIGADSNSDRSQHYTPGMETPNLNQENNGSALFPLLSRRDRPFFPTIIPIALRAMSVSFLPKNAFPLPAPLTSTLITLGLDDKAAATVSKVYLSSALTLKETCEREYNDACKALLIASDSRGYSSKELRARLLTASVTRYSQALSDWVQEITQKAKASVLKKRGKSTIQHKVSTYRSLRWCSCQPSCRREVPFISRLGLAPRDALNCKLKRKARKS